MKFLRINKVDTSPSGKTHIFEIYPKEHSFGEGFLGIVKYHAPWRRYVMQFNDDVTFDSKCLVELATFLDEETVRQQQSRKARQ